MAHDDLSKRMEARVILTPLRDEHQPRSEKKGGCMPIILLSIASAFVLFTAAGMPRLDAPAEIEYRTPGLLGGETDLTPEPPIDAQGRFAVQVGAYRTRQAAETAWRRLLDDHGRILGDVAYEIERAKPIADRGVLHQLRVGYFGDRTDARTYCARLRMRNIDCFAVER